MKQSEDETATRLPSEEAHPNGENISMQSHDLKPDPVVDDDDDSDDDSDGEYDS